MSGDPDQMHPATADLDNEEHIQPGQADRLDREEVACQHGTGLGTQERCPTWPVASRRRAEPVAT
jgi:hypothetical protein